jgi:hypothetical protein
MDLLEAPEMALGGGTLLDEFLEPSGALIAASLLLPADLDPAVQLGHEPDSGPTPVSWDPETSAYRVYDTFAGWREVPEVQLRRHRLDLRRVLMTLLSEARFPLGWPCREIVEGCVWEIGDVGVAGLKHRQPTWFARRVFDPGVWRRLRAALEDRPHSYRRMILTSTPASRCPDEDLRQAFLMPLPDVLSATGLKIDNSILAARVSGRPVMDQSKPVSLSSDGRQLFIRGKMVMSFTSKRMIDAIRALVDAHDRGEGARARDVSDHGSFDQLLGRKRWAILRPYLKSENGVWSFKAQA